LKISLIIFLIGFITIAPSIYLGIKYFDGKVTDQPYESGLMYDETNKFISDNGIGLDIMKQEKKGNLVSIEFALNCSDKVSVESTDFYITRPATDKEQILIEVNKTDDGKYASAFSLEHYGHYVLKAKSKINGKDILLQKGFYIN